MSGGLLQEIVDEIRESPQERIPFVRFMERALYHPVWGYYTRERTKTGREGDFYTSPFAGDLFGLTLSRAVRKLAETFPPDRPWTLIEMGGGDGRLAEQMIRGLARNPLDRQPTVWMVESSPFHRRMQRQRLGGLPLPVRWADGLGEIPAGLPAVLVSNELVDAFPVHRLRRQGDWREIWVAWDGEACRLREVDGPLSRGDLAVRLAETGRDPGEGCAAEVSLTARDWIREIGGWMERGYLLTVDYGGTAEELDSPLRKGGTLRGFRKHRMVTDLLSAPGETDLTADVSFTALRRWGEERGLTPVWYGSQSRFLLQAGILEEIAPPPAGDPVSAEAKRVRSLRQLALPGGPGDAFRVFLQAKEVMPPGCFHSPAAVLP